MFFKRLFDIFASFFGLLFLWPVLLIVAIMVKIKMPGGPAFFVQKRVGKGGRLFNCHKFRSMTVKHNGSSVSVAGDSRITPFGATLRHYKLDELPGLWDVLIGNMSFVGPRPDVPGYADKLQGDDRDVLKLRPGITGPATLKYRMEDEQIAEFVASVRSEGDKTKTIKTPEPAASVCVSENESELSSSASQTSATDCIGSDASSGKKQEINNSDLKISLPENVEEMTDQELAIWYNDTVIYPDKVRLNCYYYRHYSFLKDVEMIFATVLGRKIEFAGECF